MSRVVLPKGGRGRQVSLKGSQQDFGKLGNISVLEHVQWSKIPTYYYDFRRFDLPLRKHRPSTPNVQCEGDKQ